MIDFVMAAKKRTTIFKQLILNVMFPPILALLLLGVLNFRHTRKILVESSEQKNYIIGDELIKVLELRDVALNLVETNLDKRMKGFSNSICDKLNNSANVETTDLYKLRKELGMNPIMEDIYIINRNGIVINTTFKEDLNLDFFSFGEEHKSVLLSIFDEGRFKNERFTIEANSKRLKKYSYQPTPDGNYIVQIGVYSQEADEIIDFIKNTTSQIANKNEAIESVELFIGQDNPFSLNRNAVVQERHKPLLMQAFSEQDTLQVEEKVEGRRLNYQFIYMDRKNTDLYKGSVVRIISDRSADYRALRIELLKFISIFSLTLFLVILLIYFKTKVITDPIKKLVSKVNRITHGHLNERADVIGNNEITTLSKQFNKMIEELESYYNELEQKVEERTRQISQQKEEIAAQRDAIQDQRNILAEKNSNLEEAYFEITVANEEIKSQRKHIMDSIVYAKRIQNAILPPQPLIDKLVPENFVFYRPKDIVSGDFYWVEKLPGKSVIAAVDCTGHGVPGAFMSIIGSNQLDHAVRIKKAKTAGEILDALNEGVSKSLQQEDSKMHIRDGMDIALVVIDYKEMKLEFAGAYNPLYFYRKGELTQYKADKFAIGTYNDYPDRRYTTHNIELEKGDTFYIFSDGYPDQFGGPKGRKYMYKKFRELLTENVHKPFDEQAKILETENLEWRGDEVQVDDIIIIGIKI